jgi:hypothetical protein
MDDLGFIIIIILLVVVIIFFIVRLENQAKPTPTNEVIITPGGCAGTIYGCCPNSTVAKHDYIGSNCSSYNPIIINPPSPYHPPTPPLPPTPYDPPGGCAGTRYGCCPYSNVAKQDITGSNCIANKIGGCAGTQYGCCPNSNISAVDSAKSNCPIGGCGQFGCCLHSTIPKQNSAGTNCPK